jgi:hypothetical protein
LSSRSRSSDWGVNCGTARPVDEPEIRTPVTNAVVSQRSVGPGPRAVPGDFGANGALVQGNQVQGIGIAGRQPRGSTLEVTPARRRGVRVRVPFFVPSSASRGQSHPRLGLPTSLQSPSVQEHPTPSRSGGQLVHTRQGDKPRAEALVRPIGDSQIRLITKFPTPRCSPGFSGRVCGGFASSGEWLVAGDCRCRGASDFSGIVSTPAIYGLTDQPEPRRSTPEPHSVRRVAQGLAPPG